MMSVLVPPLDEFCCFDLFIRVFKQLDDKVIEVL
jgi:hypothetical protein